MDDKYRLYLYEGIGVLLVKRYPDDTSKLKEGAYLIDEKYKDYYYRGLAELFEFGDTNRYEDFIQWIEDKYKPFYLKGIGENVMRKKIMSHIIEMPICEEGMDEVYYFINNLEPEYRKYVLEGLGEVLSYFYSFDNEKKINRFINTFKEKDREIVFKTLKSGI